MTSRTYACATCCHFRYTRSKWGTFSNFAPLVNPIPAGSLRFKTSEALFQAAKFPRDTQLQTQIAAAASPAQAKRIARSVRMNDPEAWNRIRVDVMRWVIRAKREHNPAIIDALLRETGDMPIVEDSATDVFWGATPNNGYLCGQNSLGRLWMELRAHLRENHPRLPAAHWRNRLGTERIGHLFIDPATPFRLQPAS